ncbi:hypothetical protein HPP92_016654 [Vanilla planifolia]|uniref:Pyrrolidone-carboxylate peptidase n=1 Tax=Vanilla planifolia TaxID=51239 RepID=A0A835QII2_VANPL|nr:hypothetical protein HPP92_016654 [Vanilla planifolia]
MLRDSRNFMGFQRIQRRQLSIILSATWRKRVCPKALFLGVAMFLKLLGKERFASLYKTLETAITGHENTSYTGHVIWLHFGVNSGASRFAIEKQAVNEATFRCPDELGWKPQKVSIIPSDGGISRTRETALPTNDITKALSNLGYAVMASDDAGRFVCNYVYYHSLRFAEEHGIKSLFVHVPLFLTINEDIQMQFAASVLEVLSSLQL